MEMGWFTEEQAELFRAGVIGERERIIELLEKDIGDWHQISERCEAGYCHCHAIALIKGKAE